MAKRFQRVVMWFRRDLRVADNAAFSEACSDAEQVIPVFVIDEAILSRPDIGAARVIFLLDALEHLSGSLEKLGGRLIIRHGQNPDELLKASAEWDVDAVYFNRDFEPHGVKRDAKVGAELHRLGKQCVTLKDLVLQEPDEIATQAGKPYTVFTPYKRVWLDMPVAKPFNMPSQINVPADIPSGRLPTAASLNVTTRQQFECGGEPEALKLLHKFASAHLQDYPTERDIPANPGTSMLSKHLHLGTISARTIFDTVRSKPGSDTFIGELAWRDFYFQVLSHNPHVETQSFRPSLANIKWEDDDKLFDAWKSGHTGYPIVDAAMRQLNTEAWMHNRCRMIVASFLTKDLLINWQWGERYFMQNLVDGDLAANNGGWQWAAGTGTDAQPFFRIFNPTAQGEKFDPSGEYVKRYVPELKKVPDKYIHKPWQMPQALQEYCGCVVGRDYPSPVVDHAERRVQALAMYRAAESASKS